MIQQLQSEAIELLKQLIATPSFSGDEAATAKLIQQYFEYSDIPFERAGNNLWASNQYFDANKPTILLNSHHDTVKPNSAYTLDPFKAIIKEGKLYGLGSNDAGGCLVALLSLFKFFFAQEDSPYNLIMAATAEEENSGDGGIRALLAKLAPIDFALVGEPTEMQMAISEKGLLVIDGTAFGEPGHAAHSLGVNAIYRAMKDIQFLSEYHFPKVSEQLGAVKMTVTQVNAGTQHNVVPAECSFVIDIRPNELYDNQEIFDLLDQKTESKLVARSFKHNPSSISKEHPFVQAGIALGLSTYGSPTLSDQSALSCPSLKMGPGKSARSHSADEYIYLQEIADGIDSYITIFKKLFKQA